MRLRKHVLITLIVCLSWAQSHYAAAEEAPERSCAATARAYLNSLEDIAEEKKQLIAMLPPGGQAILNYDDHRVRAVRTETRAEVITYGWSPDADIVASDLHLDSQGLDLVVHLPGVTGLGIPGYPTKSRIRSHLIGRHQAYTILGAIAVGLSYRVPWTDILNAVEDLRPGPGRLRALEGVNDSIVLDEDWEKLAKLNWNPPALSERAIMKELRRSAYERLRVKKGFGD